MESSNKRRVVLMANVAVAFVLAGMRVGGVTHIAFQAVAHLFVGGWFGAWFADKTANRAYVIVGVVMSAVETACAVHAIASR